MLYLPLKIQDIVNNGIQISQNVIQNHLFPSSNVSFLRKYLTNDQIVEIFP